MSKQNREDYENDRIEPYLSEDGNLGGVYRAPQLCPVFVLTVTRVIRCWGIYHCVTTLLMRQGGVVVLVTCFLKVSSDSTLSVRLSSFRPTEMVQW